MTVIVFGSINIDLVAKTPRLPLPGETLLGRDFFKHQAVKVQIKR
jgi:ribokinase